MEIVWALVTAAILVPLIFAAAVLAGVLARHE